MGRPSGSILREQRRVAAPSIRFAIAYVLLAAAPTASPCFLPRAAVVAVARLQSRPNAYALGPHPQNIRGETPCRPVRENFRPAAPVSWGLL